MTSRRPSRPGPPGPRRGRRPRPSRQPCHAQPVPPAAAGPCRSDPFARPQARGAPVAAERPGARSCTTPGSPRASWSSGSGRPCRRCCPSATCRCRPPTGPGSPRRSPTTSSATARSSRTCGTPRSPRSWSTARTRSSSSAAGGCTRSTAASPTRPTCAGPSTRSSAGSGRRVDESSPMVDARLPDGSRVNAVIPPLAVDGSLLTIRKFAADPLTADDLVVVRHADPRRSPTSSPPASRGRLNILVSGGTGAGKTTTLNVLSSFIPEDERVVTIEDAAELQLPPGARAPAGVAPAEHRGQGRGARSATWSATRCGCAPTGSSSVRSATPPRSTCCRR